MHETTPHKQGALLKGVLLDPYKREVSLVEVRNDLRVWHRLMHCNCVDTNRVIQIHHQNHHMEIDLWFDDEFLLKEPVGPGFALRDSDGQGRIYHGYGLMLSHDDEGGTTDVDVFRGMPEGVPKEIITTVLAAFAEAAAISWEQWEKRLPAESFVDEKLRTPELELQGDFKYLAVLD